jgi:hypothetical protein
MRRKLWMIGLIILLCMQLFPVISFAENSNVILLNAADASYKPGDAVEVTVEVENADKLYASDIRLQFDHSRLSVIKIERTIAGGFPVAEKHERDSIVLAHTAIKDSSGLIGNHLLYKLTFEAKASGAAEVAIQSLSLVQLNDAELVSDTGTRGEPITIQIGETAPTPTPTPTPTPSSSEGDSVSSPTPAPSAAPGTVAPEVILDSTGVAVAKVSASQLQSAVDSATGRTLVIDVKQPEGASSVQVQIPAQQMKEADDKNIKFIIINAGEATVSIAPAVLSKLESDQASNVTLSIAKVDTASLSADLLQRLGAEAVVYDFNLSVDDRKIGRFTGNDVIVRVPYTLKPGERPNQVIVYYLAEDGSLEVVKNGKYDAATGTVEFKPKHFSKYTAAHSDVAFSDLSSTLWAKYAIEAFAARGIVQGVGEDRFQPNGQVTRAEFITILMNAFDLLETGAKTSLKDVEAGSWYYEAVASAQKLGIVNGISDTEFGVQATITRQDMAVMLYRAGQMLGIELSSSNRSTAFSDQALISEYAVQAVSKMAEAGMIEGIGDGKFAPQAKATRAQAAVIIHRMFEIE